MTLKISTCFLLVSCGYFLENPPNLPSAQDIPSMQVICTDNEGEVTEKPKMLIITLKANDNYQECTVRWNQ